MKKLKELTGVKAVCISRVSINGFRTECLAELVPYIVNKDGEVESWWCWKERGVVTEKGGEVKFV